MHLGLGGSDPSDPQIKPRVPLNITTQLASVISTTFYRRATAAPELCGPGRPRGGVEGPGPGGRRQQPVPRGPLPLPQIRPELWKTHGYAYTEMNHYVDLEANIRQLTSSGGSGGAQAEEDGLDWRLRPLRQDQALRQQGQAHRKEEEDHGN